MNKANKLVEENLGIAKSLAEKWSRRLDRYTYEEYLSTAYEYIVRGSRNFDPSKGAKPSTYLYTCIDCGIKRMIADDKRYNIRRNEPIDVIEISLDGTINYKDEDMLVSESIGHCDLGYSDMETRQLIKEIIYKNAKGKAFHNRDRNIEIVELRLFYGISENKIANRLGNIITQPAVGKVIRQFKTWAREELL